jgi:FtsP/CotA-like multicopper oxidase with cupredoxin domain
MGEDDWIGNRIFVNSMPEPYFDAATCLHRFRILNGSNARTFLIAFTQPGRRIPFRIIGTDGGLLEKPATVAEAFLAPAQRLDVLVDFGELQAGSTVTLSSLAHEPMDNDGRAAGDPASEHPGAPPMGTALDLLKINLKVSACVRRPVPNLLSSIAALARDRCSTQVPAAHRGQPVAHQRLQLSR